ncbi:MAG TPA: hypothetical protein VM554_06990 [Acidisarcina sp.]|nr:hypothetical protein [Acidisarcina sp.]
MEKLATNDDAMLILKLYELRTEALLREARAWMTNEFWPANAEEFFAVQRAAGTRENAFLRQVTSYWEMASAFVLHGCLSPELFLDCNGESIFLLAKFDPFLDQIREQTPTFMAKTQEIVRKYPEATARYDRIRQNVAKLRPVRQ